MAKIIGWHSHLWDCPPPPVRVILDPSLICTSVIIPPSTSDQGGSIYQSKFQELLLEPTPQIPLLTEHYVPPACPKVHNHLTETPSDVNVTDGLFPQGVTKTSQRVKEEDSVSFSPQLLENIVIEK